MKAPRSLFALTLMAALGACASNSNHALNTGAPTDRDFLALSTADQQAEVERLKDGAQKLLTLQRAKHMAGVPLFIGDEHTGFTIQREQLTGLVSIYPGHNPKGIDGAVSQGMYLTYSDPEGNILFNRGPNGQIAPITLLANVATGKDAGMVALEGAFSILSAMSNGVGAALVHNRVHDVNQCDDCGGPAAVVIGNASATAGATNANDIAVGRPLFSGKGM